jgi:hypothetical protein
LSDQNKQQFKHEIRESLMHKLALRREAPFIGLISFTATLWGSKLFTSISPGTSLIFQLWGYNIHLHHFNYGFVLLVVGLMLTFFEGRWIVRVQHILFGVGLGFIVDEYWLLLTFDESASVYFGAQAQYFSIVVAVVVTSVYAVIALGVFFASRKEIKLWTQLYQTAKTDEANLPN